MKRTTKAQFRRFHQSFERWQKEFGLTAYEVEFEHGGCDAGNIAEIDADAENCTASVSFTSRCKVDPEPEITGLHECLHLLLARYKMLACRRHTTEQEIFDEDERVVRVLEKALRGLCG